MAETDATPTTDLVHDRQSIASIYGCRKPDGLNGWLGDSSPLLGGADGCTDDCRANAPRAHRRSIIAISDF
jgi:hypothetical protein